MEQSLVECDILSFTSVGVKCTVLGNVVSFKEDSPEVIRLKDTYNQFLKTLPPLDDWMYEDFVRFFNARRWLIIDVTNENNPYLWLINQ